MRVGLGEGLGEAEPDGEAVGVPEPLGDGDGVPEPVEVGVADGAAVCTGTVPPEPPEPLQPATNMAARNREPIETRCITGGTRSGSTHDFLGETSVPGPLFHSEMADDKEECQTFAVVRRSGPSLNPRRPSPSGCRSRGGARSGSCCSCSPR